MDFALPELGEGVYEAEAVRWLVQPGDTVKRGQPLLEVMTDKATMEVPAPFAGKIMTVIGEPGATLKVGQVILSYNAVGDGAKLEEPLPPTPSPKKGGGDRENGVHLSPASGVNATLAPPPFLGEGVGGRGSSRFAPSPTAL